MQPRSAELAHRPPPGRTPSTLDRRIPGESLHRLLKQKVVGVARVKYPKGARFDDRPTQELLDRIASGLRRMNRERQ
jgi:hypothetical protein